MSSYRLLAGCVEPTPAVTGRPRPSRCRASRRSRSCRRSARPACTWRSPAARRTKARGTSRATAWAAVGADVAPELPARRLDREVHLALWNAETFRDDLEVVDQGLHRRVQLVPRRQHDLAVVGDPRL